MRFSFAIVFALIASSTNADTGSYLLMRNSSIDPTMRIHIATFDTKEGADYNSENCWIAAELFEGQDGVTVSYWCEPEGKKE